MKKKKQEITTSRVAKRHAVLTRKTEGHVTPIFHKARARVDRRSIGTVLHLWVVGAGMGW